jgi:hypothetical protein
MTISQPDPDVEPTGEEPAEYVDDGPPSGNPTPPGTPDDDRRPSERAAPTDERLYTSEPLEDEDGNTYVIQQQNMAGRDSIEGGGEWPDPDTPPRPPAPGAP